MYSFNQFAHLCGEYMTIILSNCSLREEIRDLQLEITDLRFLYNKNRLVEEELRRQLQMLEWENMHLLLLSNTRG